MNATIDPSNIAERLQLCLPRLALDLTGCARVADLALDSMDTVELLCVIDEEFGVRLTEEEFNPAQTLDALLETIARKTSEP